MTDHQNLHELIDRHLRGELNEPEMERLAEILDSDPLARNDFVDQARWDTRFTEVMRESPNSVDEFYRSASSNSQFQSETEPRNKLASNVTITKILLIVAVVAIVLLGKNIYSPQPSSEQHIAKIVGIGGSLQWTGNGGQLDQNLKIGSKLSGGTIEGIAPDSWFELKFKDNSTVSISGNSALTFSDDGQKKLYLKRGRFTASVTPQPKGKPMLIHTQTALLEVLGTRFEVETTPSSTMLDVSEGNVRVKRLSDGSTIDVPAKYRVIASAEQKMALSPAPNYVQYWQSTLQKGSERTYGKWLPSTGQEAVRLKAIPFHPPNAPDVMLYLLGISVSRCGQPPVLLDPGSQFIVRGRSSSSKGLYFGISVAHANGEFAGKFLAELSELKFGDLEDFEVIFRLRDFKLDPCVYDRKDEFPENPQNLIVTNVWCFTPSWEKGHIPNLEISEVELVPPKTDTQEE